MSEHDMMKGYCTSMLASSSFSVFLGEYLDAALGEYTVPPLLVPARPPADVSRDPDVFGDDLHFLSRLEGQLVAVDAVKVAHGHGPELLALSVAAGLFLCHPHGAGLSSREGGVGFGLGRLVFLPRVQRLLDDGGGTGDEFLGASVRGRDDGSRCFSSEARYE